MILLLALILPLLAFFVLRKNGRLTNDHNPPAPPGLPVVGNLHQFDTNNTHLYFFRLAKKYGPLMSMKLGSIQAIVVSSAKLAEEILKTQDLSFCSRPAHLGNRTLSYDGLDVAFAPYNDSWREMRKLCVVHLMSKKHVQSFRPVREDEVARLISTVKASSQRGGVINLNETMMSFTSSLIIRTAFGRQSEAGDSRRLKFDRLMIESQAMQGGFFVSDYLPWLGWIDSLSGMISRLDRTFQEFDKFFQELIDERLIHSNGPKLTNTSILDTLIQFKKQDLCSFELTWDHIKALLFNIFVAGTDTSPAVVVWAMTALLQHPDAMRKVQAEIRETVGGTAFVNEHDAQNLPYLKAVVKEILRLYPPAPLLIPRETTQKCTLEGFTIQPKTLVHINAWAIARDPECWERPDEFSPERFLDNPVDVLGKHFEVIPFGAGRRGCPGISMGLATVELALANLLQSFDWQLPNGTKKEDIDTEVLPGITMLKKNPLYLVPVTPLSTAQVNEIAVKT